jgi:hypothetical protein
MLPTILFRVFCLPLSSLKIKIKIYTNIILLVSLYGCKTWSVRVRALRMYEQGPEENIKN